MDLKSGKLMEIYLLEVVAKGRVELIDQLAQPDMVDEANQAFGGPPGAQGLVAHVTGFRRSISDLNITIDRIVSGQDEVMARWSFTGKHVGPWLGQPPTAQEISATVFSFFDLAGGRICYYRLWLHALFDKPLVFDSSQSFQGDAKKVPVS